MSAYQTFADLPAALAAFGAEPKLCRRHVRIDGHVRDLEQEAHPVAVSRPEYSEPKSDELPALAPPEVPAAAPAVECCRACGRPLIGEVTP